MNRMTRDRAALEDSEQSSKRQKLTPSSAPAMSSSSSSLPLRGKVFAVTGGASGIGLATAKILSARGATVCIADVDEAARKAAEAHFSAAAAALDDDGSGAPPRFEVARVDVSDRAEVDAWIEGIHARHGRLDGAANVAGVIGRDHGKAAVTELKDEEWDRIIAVNLTGTMYCLRAELRRVVDGGSIVNIASIHGLKGEFFFTDPRPEG